MGGTRIAVPRRRMVFERNCGMPLKPWPKHQSDGLDMALTLDATFSPGSPSAWSTDCVMTKSRWLRWPMASAGPAIGSRGPGASPNPSLQRGLTLRWFGLAGAVV